MNIAFPAALLFLIVLPGFVFRSAFRTTEKTQLDHKPFAEATFISILAAMVLQAIWIAITSLTPYRIDFDTVMTLMVGHASDGLTNAIRISARHPLITLLYFGSLYVFAWLSGSLSRWVVTTMKWDVTGPASSLLRFDTPWYYLFRGYDAERDSHPDGVYISAIVTMNNTSAYLYTGVLAEYHLDGAGNLDRLVLQLAARRPIDRDKDQQHESSESSESPDGLLQGTNRFYPIDGDYFVLRYSETKTLNVRYFVIRDNVVGNTNQTGTAELLPDNHTS